MSIEPAPPGGEKLPSAGCPACAKSVPPGVFCGSYGAHLSPRRGDGPPWLRIRAYAAAPAEHLLRPSVVSSLFPRLPSSSRAVFQGVLATMLVALVMIAALRWQAPLIAIGALGLMVLFVLYLKESDVFKDVSLRTLLLTAVTGMGLGIGWASLTGMAGARSHELALGAGTTGPRGLPEALAIAVGGAMVMLLPVVLGRMFRPDTSESLDGFVIGSLGALSYTAAATFARLAPQLTSGPIARERPTMSLLVEAGIQGVAMPLTAAAVGGAVGTVLWFRRRADGPQRLKYLNAILLLEVAVVLIVYIGQGFVDVARVPQGWQLGLYVATSVLAVMALRTVLQAALLNEVPDQMTPEQPVLCVGCEYVVPDMAFCPLCGMAAHASSRSSRTARRRARPLPADPSSG